MYMATKEFTLRPTLSLKRKLKFVLFPRIELYAQTHQLCKILD